MAYQTTLPGLAEATPDALKAAMVAKVADLNTALAGITPAINLGVTVDSSFFHIGDPQGVPSDGAASPFWVCIVGGGRQDGRDTTFEIKASGPQYWPTLYHNIYFYLHPDTFPSSDLFVQAELRERFRARFQDWLTWDVLNTGPTSYSIPLGSSQFQVSPARDALDEAKVTDVTKGYVLKSFGDTQWVFMAHFLHTGKIYGGS